MSVKSKHSVTKNNKLGKKEKKKKLEDSEDDIESSEEELDLTKECHPIGYYMNDRAEMINQMFSVIKGNKLKALLPPSLKVYDIDQLKLKCLDQLLGMSEKRITCILEGESLETSSESDVAESDECNSDEKHVTGSESTSDKSDDSQVHSYRNSTNKKHRKRKSSVSSERKRTKVAKKEPENSPPEKGKTLLEILELEMRARAIRALLKQSGSENVTDQNEENKNTDTSNVEHKENPNEVVDLTVYEDEDSIGNTSKENLSETIVDKRVSTFEEKLKKSKTGKNNVAEENKSKRFQTELEIRNKLFKKKIYRTRQQRMENEEEEEKNVNVNETDTSENTNNSKLNCEINHEQTESKKVIVDDPEEGEINTSEDENHLESKTQEPSKSDEPINSINCESKMEEEPIDAVNSESKEDEELMDSASSESKVVENPNDSVDCELKMVEEPVTLLNCESKADEDEEKANIIEDETSVSSCNLKNFIDPESKVNEISELSNDKCDMLTDCDQSKDEAEEFIQFNQTVEETSWRDRWLQKDGVQKIVKSSKILAKVKKRLAKKTLRVREGSSPLDVNSDSNSNSKMEIIEGSIEEYERLLNENQGH